MVHALLENYYRHRQLGISVGMAELRSHMEAIWPESLAEEGPSLDGPSEEQALKEQAFGLVEAYLREFIKETAHVLAVESVMEAPLAHPETGEDFGIPLVGITDLILETDEGPVVVDFKTTARAASAPDITHEIQLTAYAYLFRAVFRRDESSLEIRSLVKTKTPQVQTHRYPPRERKDFRRLAAAIEAYLDDLQARRFVYRPGMACAMCDYRQTHCRDWEG
jgi:hypothetical protein